MDSEELGELKSELDRLNNKHHTFLYIPFGKHKGKPISELETGYIAWCLANVMTMSPALITALRAEYARRQVQPTTFVTQRKVKFMPFGKYKGELISDLPKEYVKWLLLNCNLYSMLRAALEKALEET